MRRSLNQARWETRLLLRNGEQLLLTFVIPVGLLLVLTLTDAIKVNSGPQRDAAAVATVLTVSVMSSAFTSLAIATAFERRSGALRFLATTPLSRAELLTGKFLAMSVVTLLSSAAVVVTGILVGWRPTAWALLAIPVVAIGTAAFAAWGMVLAGTLRAEAVLAVANGLFLALLLFGGVVIPSQSLPGPLAWLSSALPSGALSGALTDVIAMGTGPSVAALAVLGSWLVAGSVVTLRTFRWS